MKDSELAGKSSVFSRLNFGRAWNRAEDRMDKSNRRGVRESPGKVGDLLNSTGNGVIYHIFLK